MRLDKDSFVEPDFCVFRRGLDLRLLDGEAVLLAVEVADTSLAYDLGRKIGIMPPVPEVWVINATTLVTRVHRARAPSGYSEMTDLTYCSVSRPRSSRSSPCGSRIWASNLSRRPESAGMRQHQHTLNVRTYGQGLYEVTRDVAAVVAEARIATGLATVFCRHTSASLLIQENADPDAARPPSPCDRARGRSALRPPRRGPDDMPAHVKAALTQTSLAISMSAGRLALGTWQGVYLFEHRTAPTRAVCSFTSWARERPGSLSPPRARLAAALIFPAFGARLH